MGSHPPLLGATAAAAAKMPRPDFEWECDVDTSRLGDDPRSQLKLSMFEGRLTARVLDQTHEVDLPDDAFTDDAEARLQNRKLHVRVGRRDPDGPAMQEKRLFNPDRHPVELDVGMPKDVLAKMAGGSAGGSNKRGGTRRAGRTPAQQSVLEANPDLYGEPAHAYRMPEVNMGSTVATSMPVMLNAGGAMDTVSRGETVVKVPGASGAQHFTGLAATPGEPPPGAEELARRLRNTAVHDRAPPGATVLAGQREAEVEAEYDERAMAPARGQAAGGDQGRRAAAGAAPPAGEEEHLLATGQRGDKVRSDFVSNKVGPEFEELTAASMYVGAESKVEPISSLKPAGAELCEMCACAPCQCGMMQASGGGGNQYPLEMTPQETKRAGKPAIHTRHRETTGRNPHGRTANLRGHAKQLDEHHAGVGSRLADYQGNVPEGAGDPDDPKYSSYTRADMGEQRGATHTGGAPIELGGPGRRRVSDQGRGGPAAGGHKTTFTTMG